MRIAVIAAIFAVLAAGCSRSTGRDPLAINVDACDLIAGVLVGIVEDQLDALEDITIEQLTAPALPPELSEPILDADELAVQARAFDCDRAELRAEVADAIAGTEVDSALAARYLDMLLAELGPG